MRPPAVTRRMELIPLAADAPGARATVQETHFTKCICVSLAGVAPPSLTGPRSGASLGASESFSALDESAAADPPSPAKAVVGGDRELRGRIDALRVDLRASKVTRDTLVVPEAAFHGSSPRANSTGARTWPRPHSCERWRGPGELRASSGRGPSGSLRGWQLSPSKRGPRSTRSEEH